MPEVWRFRSTWGVLPGGNLENWKKWFPELKQKGYVGVELNVHHLKTAGSVLAVKELCDDVGLKCTALAFSAWPGYAGPRPLNQGVEEHLAVYRDQLQTAKQMDPVKINVQSGADWWTLEESVRFFKATLAVDNELGLTGKVMHETHRNRSLFNPYTTAHIARAVPELRITADISHHVVGCERLFDDAAPEDKHILDTFIPKVYHIHARMGTTQGSQCPDPTHEVYTPERNFFEKFWKRCIEAHVRNYGPDEPITFVPEYGPYPYHAFDAKRNFSEVCDAEGERLQTLFESFASGKAEK